MKMKNKVVYRHLKPCGEVFYIGVGDLNRAYSERGRNQFWQRTVNKYSYEVQILKSNLTWEEAAEIEIALISYYGRRDLGTGPLVNLTGGGEGTLNPSEETRNKMSKAKKGKKHSEERREKISEAMKGKPSHRKGKTLSDETKAKLSEARKGGKNHKAKKVINIETGIIYDTIKEAAEKEGLKRTTLRDYLNGRLKNKTNLKLI